MGGYDLFYKLTGTCVGKKTWGREQQQGDAYFSVQLGHMTHGKNFQCTIGWTLSVIQIADSDL